MGEQGLENYMPGSVLLVEDDTAQRETTEEILRLEGFEVTSCAKAMEALTCLQQGQFDALVVDLQLPDMDYQHVLQRLAPYFGKVLTIVNTGYGSFETAKEALNLGAFAYVEKTGNARELIRQVHRAVHTRLCRDTQTLEDDLRKTAQEWQSTFDATNDAIWILGKDQRILRCNKTTEKMFNCTSAEVVGKHCWEVMHSKQQTPVAGCPPLKRAKVSLQRETMELSINGTWRQVTVDPILDQSGAYAGAIHIVSDVSRRKNAETALRKSEEKFRLIAETSVDDIWQLDLNGQVTYASPAVQDIFGYAPQEAVGLGFSAFFPGSEIPCATQAFARAVSGLKHQLLEFIGRRKDGSRVPVEVSITPMMQDDVVVGVQGVARDITERKRAQEALKASERKYRSLVENSLQGIYILQEGRIAFANDYLGEMLGYSAAELCALPPEAFWALIHPEDRDIVMERSKARHAGENPPDRYSFRVRRKDSAYAWLEQQVALTTLDGAPAVQGFVQDITLRKQAQDERDRILLLSQDLICIAGVDGFFKYVNPAWEKLLGYTAQELLTRPFLDFIHPDDHGRNNAEVAKLSEGDKTVDFENRYICKDGSIRHILWAATPFPDEELMYCIGRDNTERKRAEEALRHEKEFAQDLLRTAQTIVLMLDTGGRITYFNPYMEEISGYRLEDVRGKDWFSTFLPERYQSKTKELFLRAVDDSQTKGNINPIITKEGRERDIEWYDKVLKDAGGRITGLLAVGQDITERKRAEMALRESQQRFQQVAESTGEWIWETDSSGVYTYASPVVEKMLGYKPEELVGKKHFYDLLAPNVKDELKKSAFEIFTRKEAFAGFLNPNVHKSGRVVILETTGLPILNQKGDFLGYRGSDRDVTQRMQVEQERLDYQLRLKALASELTLTEERLKRTVATELHDRISQSLAVSRMNLLSLQGSINDPSLHEMLANITDTLTHTLNESRNLTSQLSYPALGVLGLAKAIELWLKDEIGGKHGLHVCFVDDGLDKPLDEDVQAVLFRSVREALNNIVKHAQAQNVTVTIRRQSGGLAISVVDDGIGFDAALNQRKVAGFGLLSIQESLERLGGRLEIEAEPGSGCGLTMKAPLSLTGQVEVS